MIFWAYSTRWLLPSIDTSLLDNESGAKWLKVTMPGILLRFSFDLLGDEDILLFYFGSIRILLSYCVI
jgi:hypothetical protein